MSLSRRFLALVALIAAIGVAVDVLLWRDLSRSLETEAVDHARDLAGVLAAESGIVLHQPVVDLERAVARLDDGDALIELDRYLRGSSLVSQIIVLDTHDRVVGVLPEDRELVGLDWSRQPLGRDATGVSWSETFLAPDLGDPAVTVSTSWRGGTIGFRIDLGQLSKLVGVITPPPGGFVAVVDSQGVVIGHDRPELARQRENLRDLTGLAAEDLHVVTTMWRGTEGLLCNVGIPGTAWSVLVFQPTSDAFAVARQGSLLSFAVLLGVIVMVVAMLLLIRRMLARTLEDFSGQMRLVAAGRPIGLAPPPAELAPLAASFAEMAQAVSAREAELRSSREEFRDLVEGVGSVILRLDSQGRVLYINPAGEQLFGWSAAELAGRLVLGTLVPDEESTGRKLQPLVECLLREPESLRHSQNENLTRDGRRLWLSWVNSPIRDAQGRLLGLLSVGTDLTDQMRQEAAFQALVEAMAVASGDSLLDAAIASLQRWLACDVVMISRLESGRLVALARRSGSGPEAADCAPLAGSPCETVLKQGWLLVENGLADSYPQSEASVRGLNAFAGAAIPGGQAVLACAWRTPLHPPPRLRQVLELVARRVGAELVAQGLRDRLAHTDRLEALGKLAGGVAHDFNNQLAVIMASTDLLRSRLTEPRVASLLGGIVTAAERSSQLTSHLLAFGRRGNVETGPVDVHACIQELGVIAGRTLGPDIAFRNNLHATRCVVEGNVGLLQNALLNLALNARDAMPGGGRLTVSTADEGHHLLVEVEDTGCGMSEEVQARLFEPYFTTKALGKGNGLGLPAVYGAITGMGGTIAVSSRPGHGTVFRLMLPSRPSAAPAQVACDRTALPGSGRILIAEDEPALRQAIGDFLASLGYGVTLVADGQEAVERIEAAPQGFDLLLLDIMMPRMGGRKAFELIRGLNPYLPVVVVSGFGGEAELEVFRNAGVPVLGKPCHLDHLAKVIADTLQRRA